MNEDDILTSLKNCSGCGEDCHCPYSELVAGSCVAALCGDALKLIIALKEKIDSEEG